MFGFHVVIVFVPIFWTTGVFLQCFSSGKVCIFQTWLLGACTSFFFLPCWVEQSLPSEKCHRGRQKLLATLQKLGTGQKILAGKVSGHAALVFGVLTLFICILFSYLHFLFNADQLSLFSF